VIIESGLTRPASGLLANAACLKWRVIAGAPFRRRRPKQDFRGQGDRRFSGGKVGLPAANFRLRRWQPPGTKEAAGDCSPAAFFVISGQPPVAL